MLMFSQTWVVLERFLETVNSYETQNSPLRYVRGLCGEEATQLAVKIKSLRNEVDHEFQISCARRGCVLDLCRCPACSRLELVRLHWALSGNRAHRRRLVPRGGMGYSAVRAERSIAAVLNRPGAIQIWRGAGLLPM